MRCIILSDTLSLPLILACEACTARAASSNPKILLDRKRRHLRSEKEICRSTQTPPSPANHRNAHQPRPLHSIKTCRDLFHSQCRMLLFKKSGCYWLTAPASSKQLRYSVPHDFRLGS